MLHHVDQAFRFFFYRFLRTSCFFVGIAFTAVVNTTWGSQSLAEPASDPLTIYEGLEDTLVGSKLDYFVDDKQLDIHSILSTEQPWLASDSDNINFGFEQNPIWLRLEGRYTKAEAEAWLFVVNNPLMDNTEFYYVVEGELTESLTATDGGSFYNRPIPHRYFLFPFEFKPDTEFQIYIKLQSNEEKFTTFSLWRDREFFLSEEDFVLFNAMLYGALLIMVFYNACIGLIIRERSYLVYIGYVLANVLFVSNHHGTSYQYLWPHSPFWHDIVDGVSLNLVVFFAGLFCRYFLNLKEYMPLMNKIFISVQVLCILCIGVMFFFGPPIGILLSVYVAVLGIILLTGCVIRAVWIRIPTARIFAVAWAGLIVGGGIRGLATLDVISRDVWTSHAYIVGVTLEITLLSIALAWRIRTLERDRISARADSKAKSDFLAKMSHEIRTPMNGVLGMSELLSQHNLTKEQHKLLDVVRSSGENLLAVINDILDFSKIEAGKVQLEKVQFNLNRLVEEIVPIFSSRYDPDQVNFQIQMDPKLPLLLKGDPTRLKQVLINLLSNAFKFTHHGEVTLGVVSYEHGKFSFYVEDTGIGISDEAQEKLFSDYMQGEVSTTRSYGGTGLGLSISKQLVALMGSELKLVSKLGNGSKFSFTVPFGVVDGTTPATAMIRNNSVVVFHRSGDYRDRLLEYFRAWHVQYLFVTSFAQWWEGVEGIEDQQLPSSGSMSTLILDNSDLNTLNSQELGLLQKYLEKGSAQLVLMSGLLSMTTPQNFKPELVSHHLTIPFTPVGLLGTLLSDIASVDTVPITPFDGELLRAVSVLVAEDNETNQMVIKGMLRRLGAKVVMTNNGKEALEALNNKANRFDLILMDCEMPVMDGFEAAKAIRALGGYYASIPMLALTAHAVDQKLKYCLEVGMNGHVTKPVSVASLKQGILEVLPNRQVS